MRFRDLKPFFAILCMYYGAKKCKDRYEIPVDHWKNGLFLEWYHVDLIVHFKNPRQIFLRTTGYSRSPEMRVVASVTEPYKLAEVIRNYLLEHKRPKLHYRNLGYLNRELTNLWVMEHQAES